LVRSPLSSRLRRRLAAGALALALGLPALAPAPAAARVFDPETFTLPNGMRVVVVTNQRAPVVSHMVWYRVGSADEPRGKSGIAHFLEHLMFKATDEIPAGDFSRIVARNGGRDNAFTSYDYTAYFQNIARDRLELVMKMEADRMQDLQLTDEVVLPERDVIMEERRQRTDNEPAARLSELLNATLWVHHPYGTPVIGWMHEIAGLSREDAVAHYRNWYAPNNAVLVVAGDVTAAELKPLAEKYYGALKRRDVPARVRTAEPPVQAARRVTLEDDQVRQPSWTRQWKAPSYTAGAKEHAYPLQVLETVMSGGATARLYKSLVVERQLAASVSMGYQASALNLGSLAISASPVPGGDLAALEKGIEEEVARLLKDGVTADEVETAKKRMQAEAVFARDSLQGPAYAFGIALTTGQSVEDVEAWPDRIKAVTVEQVNAAARAVLGQTDHVTGLLLPKPAPAAQASNAASPGAASPGAAAPAAKPAAPAGGAVR